MSLFEQSAEEDQVRSVGRSDSWMRPQPITPAVAAVPFVRFVITPSDAAAAPIPYLQRISFLQLGRMAVQFLPSEEDAVAVLFCHLLK